MKSKKLVIIMLVIAIILAGICAVFVIKSNFHQEADTDYDFEERESSKKKKSSKKEDSFDGSVIIIAPDIDDVSKIKADDMESAKAIIRNRLDSLAYVEAKISIEDETKLHIEIPNCDKPLDVANALTPMAKLEFLDADGNVVMDGSRENIKSANAIYGQVSEYGSSEHYVQLTFTTKGQEAFAKATEIAVNAEPGKNTIAIALDGAIQINPTVNEVINSNTCVITGDYTQEQADKVAALMNSGALPFAFKVVEFTSSK